MYKHQSIRIACIGEAMIELVLPSPDASGTGTSSVPHIGFAGDTLNTAIYLTRHISPSATVAFMSVLGTDALSDQMIEFISREQVSTDYISRTDSRIAGLYAITTDEAGERSFIYWRDNSAAKLLFTTEGPASFDQLAAFDVVFFSAITLAILPPATRDSLFTWLADFRAQPGKSVVFDSNYRPRLWSSTDEAQACVARAWSLTDIALPSLDDEMALFADKSEDDVIRRLRSYGVNCGALKRGADGPRSLDDEALELNTNTVPVVIDSTAAGDSFNGAFLGSYLAGNSQETAMTAGHDCACKVIGYRGAIIPQSEW